MSTILNGNLINHSSTLAELWQVPIFGSGPGNIDPKYPEPVSGGKCLAGHALLECGFLITMS